MDKELINMDNQFLKIILTNFISPILIVVVGGFLIDKIKQLKSDFDHQQIRRDNQMKLIDIKVESMIYALGKTNPDIGESFSKHYEIKKNEKMREQNFIDENNT